jgi:hypothetical protein
MRGLVAGRWRALRSGILWIVFSPLALLMAMLGSDSSVSGYAQVAVGGAWSACGIVSGCGRIAGALWAIRLQIVLCWIAFALYAAAGGVALALMVPSIFNDPVKALVLLLLSASVAVTGLPFLLYALRRQRELRPDAAVGWRA